MVLGLLRWFGRSWDRIVAAGASLNSASLVERQLGAILVWRGFGVVIA